MQDCNILKLQTDFQDKLQMKNLKMFFLINEQILIFKFFNNSSRSGVSKQRPAGPFQIYFLTYLVY